MFQSPWGLERLPLQAPADRKWSEREQFRQVRLAGYDGFFPEVPERSREGEVVGWAKQYELLIGLQCFPEGMDDNRSTLEAAKRMGAIVVNSQPMHNYDVGEPAVTKLRSLITVAEEVGMPFLVEIHRARMLQDQIWTEHYLDRIPGMFLTGDLSHWVVAGWRDDELSLPFDKVLTRIEMLDGRISNGQQVQIDIGPDGDTAEARTNAAWWKAAMVHWLARAVPGDIFIFRVELGPPPYQIVDLDGNEMGSTWQQGLVFKDLAARTWNTAVDEAGKGAKYEARPAFREH